MSNYTTETRTFIGASGTSVFDGWAGFRLGQRYEMRVGREGGRVRLEVPHAHLVALGQTMEVSEMEFERWFKNSIQLT